MFPCLAVSAGCICTFGLSNCHACTLHPYIVPVQATALAQVRLQAKT